uniref:Protein kinase domain-containing protein n=1 Tax=Lotharella globosa TaxID=91324 RepID=A0A7S3Z0N1_9EUKA
MVSAGAIAFFVVGLIIALTGILAYVYLACCSGEKADTGGNEQVKEMKTKTMEYRIKYSDLKFGSLLGKGNQGEVYRAKFRQTSVAVKKIDCRTVEPDIIDEFVQEVNIWHRLRNQFITKFMGVCLEYPHLCIVTELVHRGSLFGLLHNDECALTWPRRLRIASDLSRGMNYLHNFDAKDRIIHRDLKSLNVLVTQEWRAKVADFGMTRFQDNKNVMTTCGTPLWMAPEIIRRKEYNYKVDVYSYGVVLWELYTRKIPYKSLGIPAKYLVKKVAMEGIRPKIPHHCPQLYKELMAQCWTTNAKERPNFGEIVRVCEMMLKDPNVIAHHPVNDVVVAKAKDQEEQKSIVANFEVGRWKIERKDVILRDVTDTLQNAKVYNGFLNSEEVKVTEFTVESKEQKKLHAELDEVSNLRHTRLLLFLAVYFDKNKVGVITERVKRTSLHSHLLDKQVVLEWDTMLQILIDICQAMAYLHGQSYQMYRFDPTNMYLTEHWRIKIDISTCLETTEEKKATLWDAPETLRDASIKSESTDVYALGLIIWQLLTRKSPYEETVMDDKVKELVTSRKIPVEIPENVDPALVDLLESCLGPPEGRGTFEQILAKLEKIKRIGPPPIIVDEKTAQLYVKTATVYAFKTADACQVEKEWGRQSGKEGCWIICNPQEDDLYLVDETTFGRNYKKIRNQEHQFRKVGAVWARQMDKPFALKTDSGVQYGITGDFVVRDAKVKKGDLWVVDKTTFHKVGVCCVHSLPLS